MPLVNISILSGKSPEYIKAVGDSINSAVIETMGFPMDDRYQIIHEVDSERLQLQGRDGDRVMMHLVMHACWPLKRIKTGVLQKSGGESSD